MLVMMPVGRRSRQVGRARQDALADFNGEAGEILSEVRLVKSSNAEAQENQAGVVQINQLYHIGLKEAIYDSIAGPLMTGAMMVVSLAALAYGARRVLAGSMTIGTLFGHLL